MPRGSGTTHNPWVLATPSGGSQYTAWFEGEDPGELVCLVGKTQLRYHGQALDDLHAWLVEQGDWVVLGSSDEQRPAVAGTVEAWSRDSGNPVGGYYGRTLGMRGRFALYVPPVLVLQGRAEIAIEGRKARVRARGLGA